MRRGTIVTILLGTVCLAQAAVVEPGSYQVIVDRNPFNIKPPTPITNLINTPPVSTNINLVGITRLKGKPKAYLISKESNNKQEQYGLGEGEREADIEVISISD